MKSSRKYKQKTLSSISATSGGEKLQHDMADENSPIPVRILRSKLQAYRDSMMNDIKTQIKNMHENLREDISSLRDEAKKIEALHETHAETTSIQKDMEPALCDTTDRLTALVKDHETLKKDYNKLHDKCLDLENRRRRKKLRVVGINEDAEGGNPSRFMAEFFSEVLGKENNDSLIIINRAHRTLAPKPRTRERPRAMIVRLHYYTDREKILRLSREKGRLFYKGSPVHIFPDMNPEVSKLRASFNPVKGKLRNAGIPYSLYYPAKLTITVNNARHSFTDPHEAEKFTSDLAKKKSVNFRGSHLESSE
uniref:L1 transposable element RRM domain-containing protein n=1 Tax=Maylandia zebra TaxID=106582 RepID=A0A3P9BVY1_9CICH